MATYYRVDPNQFQNLQYYVIDTDANLQTLKNNNNGSCQGNLQNLNNPQYDSSQRIHVIPAGKLTQISITLTHENGMDSHNHDYSSH